MAARNDKGSVSFYYITRCWKTLMMKTLQSGSFW